MEPWIGTIISVGVAAVTIAVSWGVMRTQIGNLKDEVLGIKTEVAAVKVMAVQATTKTEIGAFHDQQAIKDIARIDGMITSALGSLQRLEVGMAHLSGFREGKAHAEGERG